MRIPYLASSGEVLICENYQSVGTDSSYYNYEHPKLGEPHYVTYNDFGEYNPEFSVKTFVLRNKEIKNFDCYPLLLELVNSEDDDNYIIAYSIIDKL